MPPVSLAARIETWPIAGTFTISRGSKREAVVVVVGLEQDGLRGQGECTPYARYGESPEGVLAAIEAMRPALAGGLDRRGLQSAMPPGAARNALDCAFWDLEAKHAGGRHPELQKLWPAGPLLTAYTLSLGTPEAMAAKAHEAAAYPLLKLKLGGDGDEARLAAVRRARPDARLVADANEAWPAGRLASLLAAAAEAGVELVEQPLPAGKDAALAGIARPVPVCADESAHARDGLAELTDRYDAVNIKLDKTGGLTEALAMLAEAHGLGLKVMSGCMVATSLAMAPALIVGAAADWVDLDGPLLLARDRAPGLVYDGARVQPPPPSLWG